VRDIDVRNVYLFVEVECFEMISLGVSPQFLSHVSCSFHIKILMLIDYDLLAHSQNLFINVLLNLKIYLIVNANVCQIMICNSEMYNFL